MTYEHLFPAPHDIAPEHRLDPLAADAYLVDGELRRWEGATETACGPVFVQTGGGLERPPIGYYPLHDEATAIEAVPVVVLYPSGPTGRTERAAPGDGADG